MRCDFETRMTGRSQHSCPKWTSAQYEPNFSPVKPKLYLETTVVSYLTARSTRDIVMTARQQITQEWWDGRRRDFNIHVSQLVLAEAARGDATAAKLRLAALSEFAVLEIQSAVPKLANALLKSRLLPTNAADDALRIAMAAVHGVHFLLTWNFRHIANATRADEIRLLVAKFGHTCPVICTPEELLHPPS